MFSQLNSYLSLDNPSSLPPPNTCIAICDEDRGQPVPRPHGSFVQLHLLSLYLRQKHPVVFFSLTDTFSHLRVISAKCGFGVQSYADSGQLQYFSGLKMCHDAMQSTTNSASHSGIPGLSLHEVIQCIEEAILTARAKFPDKAPCVVLEDIAVLLDMGCDVHELFGSIRSLYSLVSGGALILYMTTGEDCDLEGVLANFLFHFADWFIETAGLRSGLSSTIDGQLDIRIRNTAKPGASVKTCHYKVQERRIQFFAPGTSAGIL